MQAHAGRDRGATMARLTAAVRSLIIEEGFGSVGINAVARRAAVDKVLIYRYFGGLAGLLAAYAEEGGFWWQVRDLLADPLPAPGDPDGLARCLGTVFSRHVQFLRTHPATLEVIAWELSERNELTEALESVRERRSGELMRRVAARYGHETGPFLGRIGPVLALLGAAANYLAARGRRLQVFNGIDVQSDRGWSELEEAALHMIDGVLRGTPDSRQSGART